MQALRLPTTIEGRVSLRPTERSNEEWIRMLNGSEGPALEELRRLLLRGLTFGLRGTLDRNAVFDHVEDFAQDAMIRILQNLDSFRGESRFTTWAQKIALRVAFSELRRKRWENLSLDRLSSLPERDEATPLAIPDDAPAPDSRTSSRMAMELVSQIIDTELTELQRTALHTLIMQEMPMEDVASRLGTNRNALYKLLHDARKKVRTELLARGLTPDDLLEDI